MRSRTGTSAIGRLTAEIATPRSRSIVHGIPSPTASTPGSAASAWRISASSAGHDLVRGGPEARSRSRGRALAGRVATTPTSIFVPPRSTPTAAAHPAVLNSMRLQTRGGRPSGPTTRSIARGAARSSASRISPGCARRPARRAASRRTKDPAAPRAERSTARRVLKWVGIARARLDPAQLPRLRDLGADPEVEARRRRRRTRSRRQPAAGGHPADDPRPRHRRPLGPVRRADGGASRRTAWRRSAAAEPTAPSCTTGRSARDTIMLIRAGGGAFRKLSIPRDTLAEVPGQGPQKINSAYATGGAKLTDPDGRGAARPRHRPGRDHRLRRLPRASSTRSAASSVDLPDRRLLERLRRRLQPRPEEGRAHANGFQAITLARTRDEHAAATGEFTRHRRRARPVPAADPRRDQGPADRPAAPPLQLHQGPDHRLERAEGDGLEHGRADDAAARDRCGDRRRRERGAQAVGHDRAGNLVISPEECKSAAKKLLGEDPPREPNCPQG